MAFRPLQRFGGFLDRMVPQDNYGGLLSPADQRAAAQAYRAQLASGLLSAAGPQSRPVSLGQAIGAALPPAMAARDQRSEIGLRNEQLRKQIEREAREQENQRKLSGLLSSSGGDQGEFLGLLSQIAPREAAASMFSSLFGKSSDPTDLQMMDAIGLPRTPEGYAQFQGMKSDAGMKPMLDALNLQIQGLQLANMKRAQEQEDQQIRETRLTRENAIERGLEQTVKIADLTKKLEGTALAAGLPASEWRRSGMGAVAAVGGALGLNMEEINAEITAFDTLKKNLNDQLITLMSAGSLGQATDNKLQQYRDSLASPDTAPGAVMAIQAGIAETLLDQADVLQIEIPNRDKIEASIEAMKNYQPAGTETVFDAPAAAAATGRAVVRAADIGRMSLEQIRGISDEDVSRWTAEQRQALEKRLAELGY